MHQVRTGPHSWDRAACVLIQQAVSITSSSVLQTHQAPVQKGRESKLCYELRIISGSLHRNLQVQTFRGFKANIQWGCCFMTSFRMWWDFSPASQTLNQAQIVLCGCSASVGMGRHGFGPCPEKRGLSTLQDASPEDFPSTAKLLSKHSSLLWFLQNKKQAGKYLRLPENS